jgi:predicted component of type VI protein secretion system
MKYLAFSTWCLVFFVSCGSEATTENIEVRQDSIRAVEEPKISTEDAVIIEPIIDEEIVVLEKNGIKLTEIKTEVANNISLGLNTKQFKEGFNDLSYVVRGITDYNIATIENNYTLNYFNNSQIKKDFLAGNNVFLSFLTYPNKISVKTNKANVLKNVVIGDMESLFNMKQPHLFYHLPQENTTNPILDFCLVNTSLSNQGNFVKVTINEVDFILERWAAYQISGLKTKQNTIRIQLIDKNGNLVDGPFNDSGDRGFNLEIKS